MNNNKCVGNNKQIFNYTQKNKNEYLSTECRKSPKHTSKTKTTSKTISNISNNKIINEKAKKKNSKNIKKTSGISFSPKNNYVHNKSLSTSTVNNCNININNNIILSNNYFNNKNSYLQQQLNNSTKKIIEKNIIQKRYN